MEEDLTAAEQSHTCDPMDLVDIGKVLPFDMRRESGMAERLLPGFVWRKSS